ncbi:hypothetical protein D9M69_637660 [compost metagenome]
MDDACPFQAKPFERGNHRRMAAPHMDQCRKSEIRRQLQLRLEQRLLAVAVQVFDEVVQADLADGT